MGEKYICNRCKYKWRSKKNFGSPSICPNCYSRNIVQYCLTEEYRKEVREKSILLLIIISIFMLISISIIYENSIRDAYNSIYRYLHKDKFIGDINLEIFPCISIIENLEKLLIKEKVILEDYNSGIEWSKDKNEQAKEMILNSNNLIEKGDKNNYPILVLKLALIENSSREMYVYCKKDDSSMFYE